MNTQEEKRKQIARTKKHETKQQGRDYEENAKDLKQKEEETYNQFTRKKRHENKYQARDDEVTGLDSASN